MVNATGASANVRAPTSIGPNAPTLARTGAWKSKSAEDGAVKNRILLQDFNQCGPNIIAPPRVRPWFPKFASMRAFNKLHLPTLQWRCTNLGLPSKYQPRRFRRPQSTQIGLRIDKIKPLHASCTPGRSEARWLALVPRDRHPPGRASNIAPSRSTPQRSLTISVWTARGTASLSSSTRNSYITSSAGLVSAS